MSNMFNWEKNSITFEDDADGYVKGHVCQEGDRWGWSLSAHGEGRNEPAVLAENHEPTKAEAMLACCAAYINHKKP